MTRSRKNSISRLHDGKGNFVNPSNLIDIIPAIFERIKVSKILKKDSFLPIIPYNSIRILDKYLGKHIQVIEWDQAVLLVGMLKSVKKFFL